MKFHKMQLPREIIIGDNILEQVSNIMMKLGFKKSVFIVTGEKTYQIIGKEIIDRLCKADLKIDFQIAKKATSKEVKLIEKKILSFKPDVILGVGGGSKIDLAKYSAGILNIPFISIPTSASHDGISSPVASIETLGKPFSIMTQSPIAIIVDTEVIIKSPYRFVSSGCGDVLAKFTAVQDWKLAHKIKGEYYGSYAANLAKLGAKHILKNAESIQPDNKYGLSVLLEALITCGVSMGIAGSSRPCSGS